MTKVVVLLSGGMDSTTLLYHMVHSFSSEEVLAISFNYGQKHSKELEYATLNCKDLGVEHEIVDLSAVKRLLNSSSLVSGDMEVPEGHYASENMKSTVVPNRNMMMLSIAAAAAFDRGALYVAIASHAGDHAIYPDCRPEFNTAMQAVLNLAHYSPLKLLAPFIHASKAGILDIAYNLEVPLENTWSCYKGGEIHCGVCGTCVERQEAFFLANVDDPTTYMQKAGNLG